MVEFLPPFVSRRHPHPRVVEFLRHVLRHLRGKLLVIWDGLPTHRSRRKTMYAINQVRSIRAWQTNRSYPLFDSNISGRIHGIIHPCVAHPRKLPNPERIISLHSAGAQDSQKQARKLAACG